ncbi:MAG TPA: hypothetical protein VNM43_05125 [Dehalococcoidia bacterium]|nr:hypothetical protein [Dehalococcoidia bacterium]
MLFALPEFVEATLAEREAEARRMAVALAGERAVGGDRPGVSGALKLLLGELVWALIGVELPADHGRSPRSLTRAALRAAR